MQLEFFAQQELVTIVPNFSLEGTPSLFCIAVSWRCQQERHAHASRT